MLQITSEREFPIPTALEREKKLPNCLPPHLPNKSEGVMEWEKTKNKNSKKKKKKYRNSN